MTVADDLAIWSKQLTHYISGGPARIERMLRRKTATLYHKDTADAMAGDATTERTISFFVPAHITNGIKFVQIAILPTAAMAADNTDYVTVTLAKNDGAGGARTTIATYDSRAANQGALVAFDAIDMSIAAAGESVAAGSLLTVTVAKAGAGKVLPILSIVGVYDEL